MPIYKDSSPVEVYGLLKEANPGAGIDFSASNLTFGNPLTFKDSKRPAINTQVKITAVPNGDFVGTKDITYRRRGLNILTRGMTITINRYSPNQGAANSVVFSIYQLLPFINKQYGLNLTQDDVVDANIVRGSVQENGKYTANVTINAKSNSLGYIGACTLKWVSADRDITDVIPENKKALVGRTYPGGNDFSVGRKPTGEFLLFGADASIHKDALEGIRPSYTFPVGGVNNFLPWLNSETGSRNNWSNQVSTVDGGLGGLTWSIYTLPNAAVPEANSQMYNRVVTIQSKTDSWFSGRILLHYNV